MKPKTEEFLYFLLWSAEQLTRPSFRNLDDSFESWAYRNGFLQQIAVLEKQQFLERKMRKRDARVYRLTEQGRVRALGGRDPDLQWSRAWDGRWRLVLFDLPIAQNTQRLRLRRYLLHKSFGCLQKSVWITPDTLQEEKALLHGAKIDVESMIVLEARPAMGESDAEIVAGAWDFSKINRLYERYLDVLGEKPAQKLKDKTHATALRRWAESERDAWNTAVNADPLLPRRLLPSGYLGQRAWQSRIEVLGRAKRDLYAFKP